MSAIADKRPPARGDRGCTEAARNIQLARRIVAGLMQGYSGPIGIRLWNGEMAVGNEKARCVLSFARPSALRELILHRDLLRIAESHLSGGIEAEGDLEALFSLAEFFRRANWSLPRRLSAAWAAWRLPSAYPGTIHRARPVVRHARHNSRATITHHYDVGNDFYRLWLDPEMVYSCAYFRDSTQSLADAQQDKLDYLCRKLRLEPGQRVLDIGCGWGALAIWAAKHYGARVDGITLSQQQHDHANERIRLEGLEGRVTVEIRDYRDLAPEAEYDRIVSVGMFEHIGLKNFDTYFATIRRALKKGGLFLNHGITSDSRWRRTPLTRFINHYIFPDGELTRISEVCAAMERAGFEILDLESLRRHYALTLRRWIEALDSSRRAAIKASSESIFRLWRLYMAGSAYYFTEGSINVYQVLAGCSCAPLATPLRREDLYREADRRSLIAGA